MSDVSIFKLESCQTLQEGFILTLRMCSDFDLVLEDDEHKLFAFKSNNNSEI